jgi:hypothetical protein
MGAFREQAAKLVDVVLDGELSNETVELLRIGRDTKPIQGPMSRVVT